MRKFFRAFVGGFLHLACIASMVAFASGVERQSQEKPARPQQETQQEKRVRPERRPQLPESRPDGPRQDVKIKGIVEGVDPTSKKVVIHLNSDEIDMLEFKHSLRINETGTLVVKLDEFTDIKDEKGQTSKNFSAIKKGSVVAIKFNFDEESRAVAQQIVLRENCTQDACKRADCKRTCGATKCVCPNN